MLRRVVYIKRIIFSSMSLINNVMTFIMISAFGLFCANLIGNNLYYAEIS